jgi:hypothetical protein
MDQAEVGGLRPAGGERRDERPVGVAVRAGAGRDHERGLGAEATQAAGGLFAVAFGPERPDLSYGVLGAAAAGARCAAEVDVGARTPTADGFDDRVGGVDGVELVRERLVGDAEADLQQVGRRRAAGDHREVGAQREVCAGSRR